MECFSLFQIIKISSFDTTFSVRLSILFGVAQNRFNSFDDLLSWNTKSNASRIGLEIILRINSNSKVRSYDRKKEGKEVIICTPNNLENITKPL